MELETEEVLTPLFVFNAFCDAQNTRLCTVEAEDYEQAAKRIIQLLEIEPDVPKPQKSIRIAVHARTEAVPDERYYADTWFGSANMPPATRAHYH